MKIHLVYPCSDAISCPQAIGRKVRDCLSKIAPVVVHPLDAKYTITPSSGDILIGHPGWEPWHVFNRSIKQNGWARRIGLQPFCPGDPRLQAATDRVIGHCDQFLAICGKWWFEKTEKSIFHHWRPKLIHLDLAVDPIDFPLVKRNFSPAGERKFVYIGHSAWYKQPGYLSKIAQERPGVISWIGKMRSRFRGPIKMGVRDFSLEKDRKEISRFDFLLTVGNADANPTTILEAMAWGLIPVCTKESGYADFPGIVNISANNIADAVQTIDRLQELPGEDLIDMQSQNLKLLASHFNWDRFCKQISAAVLSKDSPALGHRGIQDLLIMRSWEFRSPHCWLRPRPIRHRLKSLIFDSH